MYMDGAQTTGHHLLLQQNGTAAPCPCQRCAHREPPHGHRHRPGHQRYADRPPDCRWDAQAPRVKDGVERGGHRSPQRRPVFAGPGPYGQPDDLGQVCPWDLNPAQWNYPPESGVRHYPPVREQCGCVVRGDARAHPFVPHPLPHLQVRGQGYRRNVRHTSTDRGGEEEGYEWRNHGGLHSPRADRFPMPNGNGGPRAVFFEGGEERDCHQDRGRPKGGSEEDCNGRFHKGFFTTEVPQKNLQQSRAKGPCVPRGGGGIVVSTEPPKPQSQTNGEQQQQQSLEVAKHKRRQDLVRDQIRQVVTDLEDVLGGLKQVHVEMKEVVEQIDRLTANIDLSEEPLSITQGPSANCQGSAHTGNPRPVPPAKPGSQHFDEDRIILRTNSPSPVHMASVVKTSCFTPPGHGRADKPNGHPPHLYGTGHADPRPQTLDPNVIIGNSTPGSRTQKPPPYPQNGRCGKSPFQPAKPTRTPAYPGRGRQSTSMV